MSRPTTTTDMEIIKEFRERLVRFYRFYDNKAGFSPIPATNKKGKQVTENEAWNNFESIVTMIIDGVIDFKSEIESYPLRKEIDDIKTILQYVIENKDVPLFCGCSPYQVNDLYAKLEKINEEYFNDGNE